MPQDLPICCRLPIIGALFKMRRTSISTFTKPRPEPGPFMHDPSAILAITDPALFGFDNTPISVVCDGEETGQRLAHNN